MWQKTFIFCLPKVGDIGRQVGDIFQLSIDEVPPHCQNSVVYTVHWTRSKVGDMGDMGDIELHNLKNQSLQMETPNRRSPVHSATVCKKLIRPLYIRETRSMSSMSPMSPTLSPNVSHPRDKTIQFFQVSPRSTSGQHAHHVPNRLIFWLFWPVLAVSRVKWQKLF